MATSNLDITKIASKLAAKKYAVVEFVENSKTLVEIVCTKWIRCSNNKMEVYWPPGQFHKARQLSKKQVDPDLTTWSWYESTLLLKATSKCLMVCACTSPACNQAKNKFFSRTMMHLHHFILRGIL